jgi:predicted glutamine amidotransferase
LIKVWAHGIQFTTINADGCRLGCYGERFERGAFRDVLPAWNDQNLISLARQVKTRLVLAHVRVAKL